MNYKHEIANIFKKTRIELGISQQEVADKANVTQKTVSRIENGKDNTSTESLFQIGGVLGLKMTWMKEPPVSA